MIDREQLLELARVFAQAAVDRLFAEQSPETKKAPSHDNSGAFNSHQHTQNINGIINNAPRTLPEDD